MLATPPSPRVRADLHHLTCSLSRYQSSVASSTAVGKVWPPKKVTLEEATEIIEITSSPCGAPVTPTKLHSRIVQAQADAEEMFQRRDYDAEEEEEVLRATFNGKATVRPQAQLPPSAEVKHDPAQDHYASRICPYPSIERQLPVMHESGGAWFSHKDYHTRNERPPQVFFITNERQLDALIGKLEGPVIGFDMEWMVIRRPNISLIQIADEKHVLLIQICKFPSFPTRLREMIESDAWIKVGVAILGADMSRLRDVYGVKGKGILELSHFARLMDRPVWGMENRLISLAKLAQHYLSKPLRKGDVRCSKWDGPLTSEQRQYAADDAYAGYLLFIHLERDRQARSEEYEGIWPRVQVCPPYSIAASKKMATAASLKQQVRAHSTSSRVSAATREVRQVMAILNRGKEASTESSSDDDGTFLPPMLKPIRQALNVIEGSRMNAQG